MRQTRRGRWWMGAGRRVTVAALLALAAVLGLAAPAMAADTDLQLSIVDRDPVQLGNTLVYTITVRNAGTAADDATVKFTVPSNTTFGSATVNRTNCPAPAGGTVTCPIGTLAPGASRAVVVNLEPQAVGTVSFTASVTGTGTGTDPDTTNNAETETTTVSVRPTDLAVTMSAPATATTALLVTVAV